MQDDDNSNTTWFGLAQSPDINELAKALAAFQTEVVTVGKAADNPFFKSKYADLGSIMKAALPVHAKHGLSVTQQPLKGELVTTLLHSSGQYMRSTMPLYMKDKPTAQDYGSAISYARRYSYAAILGIVIDEDDDGNAASGKAANAGSQNAPASSAKKTVKSTDPLTASQLSSIAAALDAHGVPKSDRAAALQDMFQVSDVKKLTAGQARKLLGDIETADWGAGDDLGGQV